MANSDDLLKKLYTADEYKEKIQFYRSMAGVCQGYQGMFGDADYGEHAENMNWIAEEMEKKLDLFEQEEQGQK